MPSHEKLKRSRDMMSQTRHQVRAAVARPQDHQQQAGAGRGQPPELSGLGSLIAPLFGAMAQGGGGQPVANAGGMTPRQKAMRMKMANKLIDAASSVFPGVDPSLVGSQPLLGGPNSGYNAVSPPVPFPSSGPGGPWVPGPGNLAYPPWASPDFGPPPQGISGNAWEKFNTGSPDAYLDELDALRQLNRPKPPPPFRPRPRPRLPRGGNPPPEVPQRI